MNWRNLDLNLLVVFDAVAQTRSATKAGAKLNMAQPAISHALSRLRGALRDDLFIRTPDGMEPTPYAQRLAEPIRAALQELGSALDGVAEFEPASAEQNFLIAADNRAALILSAPLVAAVAAEAPGVSLSISSGSNLDLAERLDRGEVVLAIGGLASPAERFSDLYLWDNGFTALVRAGHPAARDGMISLEDVARFPHLVISSGTENTAFVDEALASEGMARRVAFSGPLLSSVSVLTASDMVAVMGSGVGARWPGSPRSNCSVCRLRRRGLRLRCSGIGGTTTWPRTAGCAGSCAGSHGPCRLHVEPA